MKTIIIEGENLPKGKLNINKLAEELGTDRIVAALGENVVTKKWVAVVDGVRQFKEETIIERPRITVEVASDVDTATIINAVKAHNPEKSHEEEAQESHKKRQEDDFLDNKVIKDILKRLDKLEKK